MICCAAAALFLVHIILHWRKIALFFHWRKEEVDEEFRY
jgi:hypothetical protein